MIEDIREQPEIINRLAEKYLPEEGFVQGISLNISNRDIRFLSKIYIVASGSSRNAGNIAKYFLEDIVRIPVIVDYASEFAHRNPALGENDLFIAISQSGETADTFAALKLAADKGAHTFALTNNPESRIYNLAQSKMQVGAGKETSIPATKSFTAQLFDLYLLSLFLGERRGTITSRKICKLNKDFHTLGSKIQELLDNTGQIDRVAEKLKDSRSIVLLGRESNSAVAQEGALKIKETSYIDANGYPSGEFLHGYMAVVDENIPVISIITLDREKSDNYELALKNTEEIKSKRNPDLIIIKNEKDRDIEQRALFKDADFINIPDASKEMTPVLVVIILQLLSYKMAELLGRDVNNPRSLTKSLKVE